MMKLEEKFLRGSYPPVVTPFRNGKVDYDKYAELVERQAREGSHGVLVTGTTAEPSSLTLDERVELVKVAVETMDGRIPFVVATGSQSFAETIGLTKIAEESGVDERLGVVTY